MANFQQLRNRLQDLCNRFQPDGRAEHDGFFRKKKLMGCLGPWRGISIFLFLFSGVIMCESLPYPFFLAYSKLIFWLLPVGCNPARHNPTRRTRQTPPKPAIEMLNWLSPLRDTATHFGIFSQYQDRRLRRIQEDECYKAWLDGISGFAWSFGKHENGTRVHICN